jgi:hypothetical protein
LIISVYSGISPQKGYSADEDQGLMGSLAVLMKIGLFSTNGGTSATPSMKSAARSSRKSPFN